MTDSNDGFPKYLTKNYGMAEETNQKRFKIALSFPGEKRCFISLVAKYIAAEVGEPSLLYDKYFEAEFARTDLDTYLQNLYHKESELIAVFLCSDYESKEWCGLEWRAIRDLIKKRETSSVMPFRFDNTEIPGLFSTDGYIWLGEGSSHSPQDIANLILQRYHLNSNEAPLDTLVEEIPVQTESGDALDSAWFEEHIRFQKKIRDQIENELNGYLLKALRKGFTEVVWTGKGKIGSPTPSKLADELIVVDSEGLAKAEAILKILIQGTEACFEQLRAKGKKVSDTDEAWRGAKRILGCVATLAINTEKLVNVDKEAVFDKVDVKSPIAVGTYAARKKEIPATFDLNDNSKSKYKVSSGVSVSGYEDYFAEEGWKSSYVVDQMGMLVWYAVGNIKTDQPLTQDEWEKLKQDMESHSNRRRDSINYYLPVKEKNENHPLLDKNVCLQIKKRLPMLSIVHVDVDDMGSVLLIGEGILISLIEEFLSLIDRYK